MPSCKTENLGLEKVIANIIANPNIRFVLFCGTEVKGHLSGQTFAALHKGGVKDGRVVGAEGAIPFIENLTDANIKRFQEQIEVVNIMESEDLGAIKAKINELKGRDPGAFAAEAMVVEVKEAAGGAEERAGKSVRLPAKWRLSLHDEGHRKDGRRYRVPGQVCSRGLLREDRRSHDRSDRLICPGRIPDDGVKKMAEEAKSTGPVRMVAIENMVENIRYKSQILARTNKLDSGVRAPVLVGFTIGLLLALIMIVVPDTGGMR